MSQKNATRIAIIGNGNVGGSLESGLRRAGYEVEAVGKEPDSVDRISQWGDIVLLSVPFPAVSDVVKAVGHHWTGKTVVDVTNALTPEYGFAASSEESGAERLQKLVPDAKVVKAFNTVFAEHMATGQLRGERLSAFVASDDDDARNQVSELAEGIGFAPVSAGPLANARWLEALGYLNIQLGYMLGMGTGIGFKLHHQ